MARRAKSEMPAEVGKVFRAYPPKLRSKLLALREIVLSTAANTEGVGPIQETLKWGQPSYLTAQSGSGSTVRIGPVRGSGETYALFFHCQTDLVATFRELYPQKFAFEGNRAIVLDAKKTPDPKALAHCVALALTYHARKARKPR
ncbi:MAG: DUF1801 domain-containing protein [Xanthobacteraceae bacterium]